MKFRQAWSLALVALLALGAQLPAYAQAAAISGTAFSAPGVPMAQGVTINILNAAGQVVGTTTTTAGTALSTLPTACFPKNGWGAELPR